MVVHASVTKHPKCHVTAEGSTTFYDGRKFFAATLFILLFLLRIIVYLHRQENICLATIWMQEKLLVYHDFQNGEDIS